MIKLIPNVSIVWHIIIFLIVIIIMSELVLKPLLKIIKKREKETTSKTKETIALGSKAKAFDRNRSTVLDAARNRAAEYEAKSKLLARERAKQISVESRDHAKKIVFEVDKDILQEVQVLNNKMTKHKKVIAEIISNDAIGLDGKGD